MKKDNKAEMNLQFERIFDRNTAFKELNDDTQTYILCGIAKILTPNKYAPHKEEDMIRYIGIALRMSENIPLHELARLVAEHEMCDATPMPQARKEDEE